MRNAEAFFDAGKRRKGATGPAACGAILYIDGKLAEAKTEFLGVTTNNVAEWCGFLLALEIANKHLSSGDSLKVYGDSKLVVQQALGKWRTRDHLKSYYGAWRMLVVALSTRGIKVEVSHIPREQNEEADDLVRKFLDEHMRGIAKL